MVKVIAETRSKTKIFLVLPTPATQKDNLLVHFSFSQARFLRTSKQICTQFCVFFMILALLTRALHIPKARAQGLSLITDAETENLIREYSTPLFQAAGLSPQSHSHLSGQ